MRYINKLNNYDLPAYIQNKKDWNSGPDFSKYNTTTLTGLYPE